MAIEKAIRIDYTDFVEDHAPPSVYGGPTTSNFDFYRRLDVDDPKWIRWMKTFGTTLKTATDLKNDPHDYALASLPEGYTLLEHNKSQGEGKKPRTDMYLWGHPRGGRFRSTNEFIPHLIWLATDKSHDVKNCGCRLCPGSNVAPYTARRPTRHKPVYTGMSALGLVEMEKAKDEMTKDLEELAPIYRFGEVVLKDDLAYLVADSIGDESSEDLREALAHHTYTLLPFGDPRKRLEQVPHASIVPFLHSGNVGGEDISRVVKSASPVAKYNIQTSATIASGLPGPSYVAWYLGAEKIYYNDLVRLYSSQKSPSMELMLLSHIFQETGTKTMKVRGDIFAFKSIGTGEAPEPKADDREIPKKVLDVAKSLHKTVEFVNGPGLEFDVVLADVVGRYYHPRAFSSALTMNHVVDIVKGRGSVLPAAMVENVNHIFEEQVAEVGLRIGSRDVPVEPVQDGPIEPIQNGPIGPMQAAPVEAQPMPAESVQAIPVGSGQAIPAESIQAKLVEPVQAKPVESIVATQEPPQNIGSATEQEVTKLAGTDKRPAEEDAEGHLDKVRTMEAAQS